MDCRANCRSKVAFSNISGVVWTRPNIMHGILYCFLVRQQTGDVFDMTYNTLLK